MSLSNTSDMGMKYCPIEGHSELTDNIHVTDFAKLIRTLSNLRCTSKKFTEERDQIIYDFAVIVQMLATKYTKLNEQEKKDKLAAKEKAQKDKLATKEQAKLEKANQKRELREMRMQERKVKK